MKNLMFMLWTTHPITFINTEAIRMFVQWLSYILSFGYVHGRIDTADLEEL